MRLLLQAVDHLVYATPKLETSVEEIMGLLGVRATPGGQHPGRGTRNALIALSDAAYLEIIGPDPEQPAPPEGTRRWFGIDGIESPRLVAWAAKRTALETLAAEAARHGVKLGPVVSGSRTAADGTTLHWQFTDPAVVVGEGVVPFFIDWGNSPHPAASAARGPVLCALRGEHPEPAVIKRALSAVGIDLPIGHGPRPALCASLRTAKGIVELR